MGLRSGHFTSKLHIFFFPAPWKKLWLALGKYPDVLDLAVFIRVTFLLSSFAKTANHLLLTQNEREVLVFLVKIFILGQMGSFPLAQRNF